MTTSFLASCQETNNAISSNFTEPASGGYSINQAQPVLNDTNLAAFVANIVKDLDALKDFHRDLSLDFVGTLENHFVIDSLLKLQMITIDVPFHATRVEFFGGLIDLLEEYPELQAPSQQWKVYCNIIKQDTLVIEEPEEDEGIIILQQQTTTTQSGGTTGTWTKVSTTKLTAKATVDENGNTGLEVGIERADKTTQSGTGEPPSCCFIF